MFWLGSVHKERYEASRQPGGPRLPSIHSSQFHPDPEPTINTGVRCLSHLTLSLLKPVE
jgi:hippurate hydrolase